MKKMKMLYGLIIVLMFISCNETKKVVEVTEKVSLTGNYIASSINNYDIVNEKLPTFSINELDNSIKGNASCNGYLGNYTLNDFTINFGLITATEMYCSELIMEVERAFFKALSETGFYSLENNILTLYSKANREVLLKANKNE